MPVVTAIKSDKRGRRLVVWLDGEPGPRLSPKALAEAHVSVGGELGPEAAARLARAADVGEARERALRSLEHRARSREELRRRLADRGHAPDVCDEVLDRLEHAGLIDDLAFARQWVRSKISRGPVGESALRAGLRRAGVADETIDEALAAEYDRDTARAVAVEAASKRWQRLKGKDPVKARRSLWGYLVRRGLEVSDVQEVLAEVAGDE